MKFGARGRGPRSAGSNIRILATIRDRGSVGGELHGCRRKITRVVLPRPAAKGDMAGVCPRRRQEDAKNDTADRKIGAHDVRPALAFEQPEDAVAEGRPRSALAWLPPAQ